MWFLIKGTVWFSMALVVLSYLGTPRQDQAMPSIDLGGTIAAATGAYDYLSGLCTERPDVCSAGAETFAALGERAKAGALVAYQILDQHLAKHDDSAGPQKAERSGEAVRATVPARETAAMAGSDPVSDLITTGTVGETAKVPVPRPKPTL